MGYNLDFAPKALQDIEEHKKIGNKAVLRKINVLLDQLSEHPFIGTENPNHLNIIFLVYRRGELIVNTEYSIGFLQK